MQYIHEATGQVFFSLQAAGKALGVLGLSEDNRQASGFGVVTVTEKPAYDPATQKVQQNANPTDLGGGVWEFQWTVVDKTIEEIDQAALAEREAMAPARWAFANAAFASQIITGDEALAWANGNQLPASIDAAISAAITDPAQLVMAKVQALSAPTVRRLNPMIAILQQSTSMTDEQVDALFTLALTIEQGN